MHPKYQMTIMLRMRAMAAMEVAMLLMMMRMRTSDVTTCYGCSRVMAPAADVAAAATRADMAKESIVSATMPLV